MTSIAFSPCEMFFNAGPAVCGAMILLAAVLLLTGTIFIAKLVEPLQVRMKLTRARQTSCAS